MLNNLGIYIGIKGINIINLKGKKILNSIKIPAEKISSSELEEKIPQDVKIVALIKDELRKQKIEAKNAGLALSGKDLIIRSFDLPFLPREELQQAVSFEAKKYLPFKSEEIISDFEIRPNKKERKNLVLFFGIKKETVENYFSIMNQLGLKLSVLEYSGFGFLRLAKLMKLKTKGTFAFLEIDLEDETNFIIFEEGFPLFSRDIDLGAKGPISGLEAVWEQLKGEIQLSLDYYYHRKFPSKRIEKIFFFTPQEYKDLAGKAGQELEIPAEFVDINAHLDKTVQLSPSMLKAYSVSLADFVRLPLDLDLIFKWEKLTQIEAPQKGLIKVSLKQLRLDARIVILGFFIIILTFVFGLYQRAPLKKELFEIIGLRPNLLTVSVDRPYDELKNIETDYNGKISTLNRLLENYPYLTLELNAIPKLLPQGVWLLEYSFRQGAKERELLLKGAAYFKEHNQELEAINTFFSNLKSDPEFSRTFKLIDLFSIERGEIEETEVTKFAISCKY